MKVRFLNARLQDTLVCLNVELDRRSLFKFGLGLCDPTARHPKNLDQLQVSDLYISAREVMMRGKDYCWEITQYRDGITRHLNPNRNTRRQPR